MAVEDRPEAAVATLDERELAELTPFGEVRAVPTGAVLYRAGDPSADFYVVLEGEVEVVRGDGDGDVVIVYDAGRFLGELNLLTGQT